MVDLGKEKNLPQKRAIAEKKRSATSVADLQELVGALMEQNKMLVTQIADMQEAVSGLNENV